MLCSSSGHAFPLTKLWIIICSRNDRKPNSMAGSWKGERCLGAKSCHYSEVHSPRCSWSHSYLLCHQVGWRRANPVNPFLWFNFQRTEIIIESHSQTRQRLISMELLDWGEVDRRDDRLLNRIKLWHFVSRMKTCSDSDACLIGSVNKFKQLYLHQQTRLNVFGANALFTFPN